MHYNRFDHCSCGASFIIAAITVAAAAVADDAVANAINVIVAMNAAITIVDAICVSGYA